MPDDDFIFSVRQILDYPPKHQAASTDFVVTQDGSVGHGPYSSMSVADLVATALEGGGFIHLAPASGIAWNGAALMWDAGLFSFTEPVSAPNFFVGTFPVATQNFVLEKVTELADSIVEGVTSFNGRTGRVILEEGDVLRAGAVTQNNAHFSGIVTAPTIWDSRTANDQVATTAFVHEAIRHAPIVHGFNGRVGCITLTADDITAACTAPGAMPRANTPPWGDASTRIATTMFVDESVGTAVNEIHIEISQLGDSVISYLTGNYAPIDSPQFTGNPTAPTANPGNNTGQIATTSFVMHAIAQSTAGVATWNGRTGIVTMTAADITAAGGALLVSPAFTGAPTGPNPALHQNNTQLATCAWVMNEIGSGAAGVTSFNTRTGTVTLSLADVTATGVLANTPLTGTPTGPTAAPGTATTQLATTAFVTAAVGVGAGVTSFNTRTGAITLQGSDISAAGGALITSPTFTGTPSAPTANVGTSTTQIATTAFVTAAVAASTAGVSSFNTRTGAVTLQPTDLTNAGGALLASPAFTGTPTGPTATAGTNTTQLATTAFVQGLLASPAFTGAPTAPTAAPGTSSTQLATTAFVAAAIAAMPSGGVTSFNTRTGAVSLQGSDISAAGGALVASPTFTGAPAAPTAAPGTNTQQLATTAFVMAALTSGGGVSSFNGRAGAVTLNTSDIIGAGGVLKAGDTMTGLLTIQTASPQLNLQNTSAGPIQSVFSRTGGSLRWAEGADGTSESGSNAGSNYVIQAYSDTGTLIDNALIINRALARVSVAGDPTTALGVATKQYVDARGAGGKQTLWIPAAAMTPNITSGATPGQVATPTNGNQVRSLDFAAGVVSYAQFEIAMPKSWDAGPVTFQAVVSVATGAAGSCQFSLSGAGRGDGQGFDVTLGTAVTVMASPSAPNTYFVTVASGNVTINGASATSNVCIFQVSRSAGDGFTQPVRLHGIRLFYNTTAGNDA